MDVSTITGKATNNWSKDMVENPKGKLDKDAFLKLFLTELQYQDPTEPMDNEKILTQTSQLTQLEAQEEQKKSMKMIAENFNKTIDAQTQFSLIPSIGKLAQSMNDSIEYKGEGDVNFELYFEKPIKTGNILIKNERNETVKTISLENYTNQSTGNNYVGKSGVFEFKWDGRGIKDEFVPKGKYKIVANYVDNIEGQFKNHSIDYGTMPITSVRFENGSTMVKLGSTYHDYKTIREIR